MIEALRESSKRLRKGATTSTTAATAAATAAAAAAAAASESEEEEETIATDSLQLSARAPQFDVSIQEHQAPVGSRVVLRSTLHGAPPLFIEWSKDDRILRKVR